MVAFVPVKDGLETVPDGVKLPVEDIDAPVNLAPEIVPLGVQFGSPSSSIVICTVPLGVPETLTLPAVPVKVGLETVPDGVKLPVDVIGEPANVEPLIVPLGV